jgi:predicted transposase YdaD
MTTPTTSTPHDAVFKTFYIIPKLHGIFSTFTLPAELRMLCDLNSLQVRKLY